MENNNTEWNVHCFINKGQPYLKKMGCSSAEIGSVANLALKIYNTHQNINIFTASIVALNRNFPHIDLSEFEAVKLNDGPYGSNDSLVKFAKEIWRKVENSL